MKKFFHRIICLICVVSFLSMTYSCGDNRALKVKDEVRVYETYGLFNESNSRSPNVEYKIIVGNVIWSILLIETLVFPIYFIGFSLWEPVGVKGEYDPGMIGVISE